MEIECIGHETRDMETREEGRSAVTEYTESVNA